MAIHAYPPDVGILIFNLAPRIDQRIGGQAQRLARWRGQIWLIANHDQTPEVTDALGGADAEFI